VSGFLSPAVTSKDLALEIIRRIGVAGGAGYVFEYSGSAIRGLSIEERMTLCNMSIEAGARAALVGPDDRTFHFLAGRPGAPQGIAWDQALERWRGLASDEGAAYDKTVSLDATGLQPMVTFGTNPEMAVPVTGVIPDPRTCGQPAQRDAVAGALRYMGLTPGQPILGQPLNVVFIGSCTNSRLSDLVAAAFVLRGRRIAPQVRVLVVPGSQQVKRDAEALGLDRIFRDAGAEWREPGCSLCIAMNGDELRPGEYCLSTSNRNFEGRQGAGGRTILASVPTAAASALKGAVADPREDTTR